ncbi:MAG: heparinase II/III family protein [Cellulosilyticaceae bacterium]
MSIQNLLKEPISTGELLKNLRSRLEPMEEKIAYISEHMPELVKETIANAEESYKGMVKLPGTGGVREFVGNPPCWLERRHDDNEFLWQLNRMTYWQEMLEAYSLTKDEKYAKKVISEMLDWIEVIQIPDEMYDYPLSYFSECNPLRALELGIRNYKIWPLVLEHLGKTDLFTEEVLEKYLGTVYKQIRMLRKVSPQLWPKADHNHFLMECLGILTTALYFPEFKEADEWRAFAIDGIERCCKAQLTEDGGQIEGCPSYHNGCMFWFGLAVVMAERFDFKFSEEYMELFRKNLDYSIYALRPTGKCVPVGDSHANNLAIMGGVYGYFALGDMTWLGLATNLIDTEEVLYEATKHVWRALDVQKFYEDLNTLKGKTYECDMKTTFWNRTLSQAIIRSDWDREALSFLMTCKSPIQNLHAHIDLMSFDFTALGKNMVCDPGIFCYRNDADRKEFKSSAYHSTLMIDDRDHFEYIESFGYGPQKFGEIYNVEERAFYSLASAYHTNYEPIIHHRHMALVDDSFVVVVDKVDHLEENEVKRYFHLDFTNVEVEENKVVAKSDIANLALYSYPSEQVELLPGRLSDVNDIARPATRVLFKGKHSEEKHYITLLIPYKGEETPEIKIREVDGEKVCYEFSYLNTYRVSVEDKGINIFRF